MKKRILNFFIISLLLGNVSISQTVVYTEDFNSGSPVGIISSAEWIVDDFVLPQSSGYPGASASYYLAGSNGSSSLETVILNNNISTLAFTNVSVSWGAYKETGFPGPVTFEWSVDGTNWFAVSYTDVAANSTWASVGPVALPAGAGGAANLQLRWSYTSNGNPNYFAMDDIVITGDIFQYFSKSTGNLDLLATWGTNLNGTGTSPANFTMNGITYNIINNANPTIGSNWTVTGLNSFVTVGSSTFATNFLVPTTAVCSASLNVTGNSTVTIENLSSPVLSTLAVGSTINFAANGNQTIYSPSSPQAIYSNLTISGSGAKTYTNNITVNSVLNISNGTLTLFNNAFRNLTLNGTLTGSGVLAGSNGARITIGGSGNFGTLNFAAGTNTLHTLSMTRLGGGLITLGSNLCARTNYIHNNGNLSVNGFSLVLNGSATFPSTSAAGVLVGSSNSELSIINAGVLANSLFLDQTSTSSRSLKALNLNRAVTLNIGNPCIILDSLKIFAGTVASNGNLSFPSTSTLKARVAEIGSTGSLTGNITVQTFAPGGTTDWSVIGVSGVSGQVLSNWDGQIPMTCNGCTNGTTTAGGPFASAVSWDESVSAGNPAAYVTMSNSTPLTPGQGFWIYLGTGLSSTSDMTWNVTGPAVTGNVSIPLTNSGAANGDGYNLISNPYPSPISWAKLRNGNALVDNAIYIYNADLGLTTSYVNGVSTPASSSANDVIPMGQGFYVRATGNTNLTAQESNKVHHNTGSDPLLKSSQSSANPYYGEIFRLNINGGGFKDDAAIRFHPLTTSNFDSDWDALKLYSSPGYMGYPGIWNKRTSIATQCQNQDLSVNSMKMPSTNNLILPVVVKVYSSGQHTISASELENIPSDMCVTLKDKYNNLVTDLRTSSYVCHISDTTSAARFELTVCAKPVVTQLNTQGLNDTNLIFISKDNKGIFTTLSFPQTTKATISVTNILGQKLMNDKVVNTKEDQVYLDLNTTEQLIFVTVKTDKERVTKKFVNIN